MSQTSSIEWTNSTWNPVTGCTKISPGCKNCYAETFAERWRGTPGHPYEQGFDLKIWKERFELPLTWKKPRTIFVNSMSDLFHEKVPFEVIQTVFGTMIKASWHTFQVLTKRSDRLKNLAPELPWTDNIWMGVSIESTEQLFRLDHLRESGAVTKFASIEPLLGPLPNMNLNDINWIIVGGESGPHARPMDPNWVIDIKGQCDNANVPFFFKQWGGKNKKKAGRLFLGKTWDAMPAVFLR